MKLFSICLSPGAARPADLLSLSLALIYNIAMFGSVTAVTAGSPGNSQQCRDNISSQEKTVKHTKKLPRQPDVMCPARATRLYSPAKL